MRRIKGLFKGIVTKLGYEVRQIDWTYDPDNSISRKDLCEQSREIVKRHFLQTKETVLDLKKKYQNPVFGKIHMMDLLKLLGQCIDPSDTRLAGVSQLTHILQVAETMEESGIADPNLLIAALVHDVGKVLLLTDEEPENVTCMNKPIGEYDEGIGLDNCFFQWNHDEFAYSRLEDYLPDHISWLIRYHSILIPETEHYMNQHDREHCERYLIPFRKYDQGFKSVYRIPRKKLTDYMDLIDTYFPREIVI